MPRELGRACIVKLASVADEVANAPYAEGGLHGVVQAARDIFHAQTVAVVLMDEETHALSIKLSRGLSSQFVSRFQRDLGSAVLGEVIRGAMALKLSSREDDKAAYEEVRLEHEFNSAMAVHMAVNHKPIGYLYCDHAGKDFFTDGDIRIMRVLASLAALAVQKANLQEQIARLTIEDPATGLSTYSYFYRRLSEEMERVVRYGESVAVLLVEVTNLSRVEDVYGGPAARMLLRQLARLVRENTRGIDFAARFGSNQAILCLVRADETGLRAVAERVLRAVANAEVTCPLPPLPGAETAGDATPTVTKVAFEICGGAAIAPAHGREASLLVTKAEKALLDAKRAGAGSLVVAGA